MVYIANQKFEKIGDDASDGEDASTSKSKSARRFGLLSSLWATGTSVATWFPLTIVPRTELSLTTLVVVVD